MPDVGAFLELSPRHLSAVVETTKWLSTLPGRVRPLTADELRLYRPRKLEFGWRIEIAFPDGNRNLDVLVDGRFPRVPPKIAVVDRPTFMTWPHVEEDGVLCLFTESATWDFQRPIAIVQSSLAEACGLIEELASGGRRNDFQSEFLSYWNRLTDKGAAPIRSLLKPSGQSRLIHIWRGADFFLVGETESAVRNWLNNYCSTVLKSQKRNVETSILFWLEQPLLPSEYPKFGSDVLSIARRSIGDGEGVLRELVAQRPSTLVAVFGAMTTHGVCLGAVTIVSPTESFAPNHERDLLTRGFRPNKVPRDILIGRYLGKTPALKSKVDRIDPAWVHGRDQDSGVAILRASTVAVIGCGSVGAPVALMLAQAGVGRLILVDPDELSWANVGRHPLGAKAVGRSKAQSLADRIRTEYPHVVGAEAKNRDWQDAARESPGLLASCDLIICATGSWCADGALNEWHQTVGRTKPIVYGWVEPHACAGHAVAIAENGGCLQCGMSATGVPLLHVTDWPVEATLRHEPACGAVYQPYGPVELSHVVGLIADLSLDCLMGEIEISTHRIWATRQSNLEKAGGQWTPTWAEIAADRLVGGFIEVRDWPIAVTCIECGATQSD